MERSRNQNLLPMKGTVERETRRKALEARATRLVIQAMQQPETRPQPPQQLREVPTETDPVEI